MTILKQEVDLLIEAQKYLKAEKGRPDLAFALSNIINRVSLERGMVWGKTMCPPKTSGRTRRNHAKTDTPLMKRLLDAGYPRHLMDHHESDLYVYVTPDTTKIIKQWCKDHKFDMVWHCPIFCESDTGRPMYACAFQYCSQY